MIVLSCINQKGGVGKTTSAISIASVWAESGLRVLLVDLDPQGSASSSLGVRDPEAGELFFQSLKDKSRPFGDLVQTTSAPNLKLIPSSEHLGQAESQLTGKAGCQTLLKSRLAPLSSDFDVVMVDCPPSLGLLSINALAASHFALIPLEAHPLSIEGLAQVMGTVADVADSMNDSLQIAGILLTRLKAGTNLTKDCVALLQDTQEYASLLLKASIRENIKLAEAPSHGKPVTIYAPKSPGADDYRAVADELAKRMGMGVQK